MIQIITRRSPLIREGDYVEAQGGVTGLVREVRGMYLWIEDAARWVKANTITGHLSA